MKSKHWIAVFLLLFFIGIGGFMALNYYVDPTDYFSVSKNKESYSSNNYTRAIKSEYLAKNPDKFDAVVMSGSKGGVLSTDLLTQYTGKRYYNFFFNVGNFSDYYKYSKFLIENTNISEITLHLSSFEVTSFSKEGSGVPAYEVPAILTGNKWEELTEHLSYLMTDVSTTMKALINNEPDPISVDMATGQRNWNSAIKKFRQDPDAYVQSRVLKKFDKYLASLFNQDAADSPAFDDNIAALKEIKELCDENGVTLKVVIGASFIGERESYECYRYYDYLRQIVAITDVWDFSDYNDINMNPYNFYNRKHYTNAVGDLMINTIYGKETHEGFGIYLTEDNIEDYLARRIADYRQLKEEFDTTGTVQLPGMDDPSYIS